ncbi:hypothetical protein [Novosphingobium pentaromativorans]|uniref:Uncharacterized protein n=1 Tax=Novosphingobium pentaromativorans US6-1 TaxID=1088721 RepID=G6EI60_9SPHN|nr:hypothetical protein [Novosphingobium pentaromativorans]AIT78692.1 hypothetical protein JI59_02130 [Novosphingobium pentaromativorans US6-1]EHJ58802.1 hypothetical protein NSU_4031 [Novosphingobium pentaromativorans US6-1]
MKSKFVFIAAMTQALCAPALAQPAAPVSVATDSAVFVEKVMADSSSRLEPAARLSRGDKVVTVVTWYRMGGNGGFVITNPMPTKLAYEASANEGQEVSVDGGRTWGHLGALRKGGRLATAEDVTHVRWRIPAGSAANGRGQLAYSAIVR